MSDPFDALRGTAGRGVPDVDAIKSRARGIERRRRLALASSAVVIAAIALTGVVVKTRPGSSPSELAQSKPNQTVAPEREFGTNATPAAPAAPGRAATTAKESRKVAATPSTRQGQRESA